MNEQELNAAKSLGLLTLREWACKYDMKCLLSIVDAFSLDGGRGFVHDRPAGLVLNDDGTRGIWESFTSLARTAQ